MPAGTENLVARHFGLRRDPRGLARTIAAGRSVPVDVARADGRRFLLMAGFGFDADVVTRHHRGRIGGSGRIRPTSRMAYVEHIVRSSFSYRFPTISVQIVDPGAEEVVRGTTVFFFNLPRYALGLPFAPVAREDDGWLDLVVFRHPGPLRALYYLWKVVLRHPLPGSQRLPPPGPQGRRDGPGGDPRPARRRPRRLPAAASRHPGRWPSTAATSSGTVTGRDRRGTADWTVDVLPSALSMIVPSRHADRTARAPLASNGPA